MRPIAVLLGVVLLVVAGCSGDDAPATTTTTAPATTQPAAESTTPPSSAEAAVDATVVYEPGNCTYFGPAVVPFGSTVTFEFDDGGHAVWFAVGKLIDGATREEIVEYNETHGGPDADELTKPDYAVSPEPEYYQVGAGSLEIEFWDDCDWAVLCWTPPDLTNKFYLGGMIKVTTQPAAESTTPSSSAEAAVDAAVIYEPGSCTYLGPAVIPRSSTVTFEFDDGGHAVKLIVDRVVDARSREEIIEYNETHGGPDASALVTPYFLEGRAYHNGAGLLVVEFSHDGDYSLTCLTPPDLTNRAYLGGMIRVIEG